MAATPARGAIPTPAAVAPGATAISTLAIGMLDRLMQGKEHPMRAEPLPRTPRSGFAPLCAKLWALLCLALSCLNPSPDDQPSRKTPDSPADGLSTDTSQAPSGTGGNDLQEQSPEDAQPVANSSESGKADAGVAPPDAGPVEDAAVEP